ncbi:hypothetical protein BJF78_08030 [Pseudonocardia sp. CNS-139]|nr:hypothetical protein BJF78_08030 [Pseudonocardia sp. CNS-139]
MTRIGRLLSVAAAALAGAAVASELRKPPAERTWHGQVAGVPYDFRAPTVDKVLSRMWAPDNPALLVPHVFGVGWTVNLASVAGLVGQVSRDLRGASAGDPPR